MEYNDKANRHYMQIQLEKDRSDTYYNALVAHEMGHLLGMVHEHQRPDRNWWLHWDCSKVYGYAAAKGKYDKEATSSWPSMEEICNSNWMGSHYLNWPAPAEYSQDIGSDFGKPSVPSHAVRYDKQSIMGYASHVWSDKEKLGVKEAPIVYWKEPGYHKPDVKPIDDHADLIPEICSISDDDVEFVRTSYPWGKSSSEFRA